MIRKSLFMFLTVATSLIADDCCLPYCWSGFYIGMSEGYGWGRTDTQISPLPTQASFGAFSDKLTSHPNGWMGGGQLGYNWQIKRRIIIGAEFDTYGAGLYDSRLCPIKAFADGALIDNAFYETVTYINWFGTIRARFGYAPSPRLFFYTTGGCAWGNVECKGRALFLAGVDLTSSVNNMHVGWTVGAGFEYAFANRWSLKTEYLYMNFGKQSVIADPLPANPPFQVNYAFNTQVNSVRAGLNYKFSL